MRRIFALLVTLTIISCGSESDSFKLSGTAVGFADNTEIMVYAIKNNQPKIIDTIQVVNEQFEASFPKTEEVGLNYLLVNNSSILYFPENEDLKVTIYKDSVQSSFVTGSKQNDSYRAFAEKIRGFNVQRKISSQRFNQARQEQNTELVKQIQQENAMLAKEETAYKKLFISENNNTIFSAMLISEMLSRKEMTPAQAKEYIEDLSPKIAATDVVTEMKTMIASIGATDIGGKAPDFSAPTPTGEMLSLKETLGKYTIIDFWASWCRPCRAENPNVVRVYKKYHDKGLNIISVSLDKANQKERWIKAIATDDMDWYHVSNLKFWQDPIAKQYSVRSIPATFLLDENGIIVAKNLRGPALETKIASLLGQ